MLPWRAGFGTRRAGALAACAAMLVSAGCGDEKSARLVDYLDELEFDVPLETAAYVSLGAYDIPITATRQAPVDSKFIKEVGSEGAVWMRLQFDLTAETSPTHEKAVLEAAERHRGALNDAVLTIVRTSTVDELADPRLAAMNARLTEVARPMLGEERVRQLVFNDPNSAPAKHGHGDKHGGHGEDGHGDESHGGGHGAEVHGEEGHGHDEHGGGGHGEEEHGESVDGGDDHGHH